MHCPICNATTHIHIDTHAEGFAANLAECGDCGSLWAFDVEQTVTLIHGPVPMAANG